MENTVVNKNQYEKIGAWRGGWLLLRASWSTLKADKEMVSFPLLSVVASIGWFIVTITIMGLVAFAMVHGNWQAFVSADQPSGFPTVAYDALTGLVFAFGIYLIANYYMAALVASALHRFNGNYPTVKYGLGEARKRFGLIAKYSLLQATVGTVLRIAQERLPFAGKITALIVDVAWAIVSTFAVPVIVASNEPVGPITAVRRSAGIFKKTWGQNFVGGLSMASIFAVAFLGWIGLLVGAVVLAFASHWTLFLTVPILAILFVLLTSVTSALSGIFNAALYYFATTGQSPAEFDHNLLMAAFKPKKHWFA